VVGLGHPEKIGDDEHREGLRERVDELALIGADELVELLISQPPHERLVVLEPLGRDQPHEQRALTGVHRRVHRDHVLVHREPIAIAIDDVADVVTLERDREGRVRSNHRVARREGRGVAVDLGRLVVASHGHDPEMRER